MRRRTVAQLVLEHGNVALIAALAGLVALVVTGTQVLDWYWPLLLLALFFGIGVWRLRNRIPSDYQLAQMLDTRLELHDTLSTAFYFSQDGVKGDPHPAVVQAQRREAEKAAAMADPVAAAPIRVPQRSWVTAALLVVSLGLLAARYGLRGDLDLSRPMVHIPFETFLSQPEVVAKKQPVPKPQLPKGAETIAVPSDGTEERAGEKQETESQQMLQAQAVPGEEPGDMPAQKMKGEEGANQGGKEGAETGEKGEGSQGGEEQSQKSANGAASSGKENAKSSPGNDNPSGQPQPKQNDNSMVDKMRDAMANMLSRMRMSQQASEGGQKTQSAGKGSPQAASAQSQQGKKGSPSPGKMQAEGQQQSEQEGEQQGEGASKSLSASNRTDGVSDKQAPQEGKSGAGQQDGDKDIKAAEQQAAMGKISELLGKRAKDLTGDVMVEVSSGRQQLKTQMSQRSASHSDSGGEISRDEVPAAYQDFVQQYFEELRKPSAAPKAKPAESN